MKTRTARLLRRGIALIPLALVTTVSAAQAAAGQPDKLPAFVLVKVDDAVRFLDQPTLDAIHSGKLKPRVKIKGRLQHGIMAIGGETTGTIIHTRPGPQGAKIEKIVWELDLGGDRARRKTAEQADGKTVIVTGTVSSRPGVEIERRTIVRVDRLTPLPQRRPK